MKRRLLNALAALSLLLCAAVIVLWVRSYRVSESLKWERPSHFVVAHSGWGRLSLSRHEAIGPPVWLDKGLYVEGRRARGPLDRLNWETAGYCRYGRDAWNFAGFRWNHGTPFGRSRHRVVVFPHWPLAILSAAPPLAWLRARLRRRRRLKRGLCPACGYDLRATPETGGALLSCCPECGARNPAANPGRTTHLLPQLPRNRPGGYTSRIVT